MLSALPLKAMVTMTMTMMITNDYSLVFHSAVVV